MNFQHFRKQTKVSGSLKTLFKEHKVKCILGRAQLFVDKTGTGYLDLTKGNKTNVSLKNRN